MAIVTNSLSKDSRWLQLEVCREFQRNKCSRPDTECKFAHPASNVEVQNGRVVACYDSIKGRCNREKPPCKYFHPPQHLKDQLLINGRNYLALKNALQSQSQMSHLPVLAPAVVGIASSPVVSSASSASSSYFASAAAFAAASAAATGPTRVHHLNRLQRRKECESRITGVPIANGLVPGSMASAAASYAALSRTNQATSSPYMTSLSAVNSASAAAAAAAYGTYPLALIPNLMSTADHLTNYGLMHAPTAALITAKTAGHMRTDRLEICREHQRGNCKRQEFDCRYAHVPEHVHVDADGLVTVCMDFLKGGTGGNTTRNASTNTPRGCTRDQCRYFHPPSHLQAQLKARTMPIVSSMPSNVSAAAAAAAAAANVANLSAAVAASQHQVNHHHHHHQMVSNAIQNTPETMSLVSLVPQHHLSHLAPPSPATRPTHPYRL